MENEDYRPQIETLACPYSECPLYAKKGADNLTVRKVYAKDRIRYLRCRTCAREFSERKRTALFNTKISVEKAISVAEHLSKGVSTKGTSLLLGVNAEAIRRLRRNMGDHSRNFHDEYVQEIEATAVQMDERYGYVKSKGEPFWEATALEPQSRLLIGLVGGRRDEGLIKELMESTRNRLKDPADLMLMTDGHRSYESLFAFVFGSAYRPARKGGRGRFPKVRHRINRRLAHLQVIKSRHRGRVLKVSPRVAHGSYKRVNRELERLTDLQQAKSLCHRASERHGEKDERLSGQEEPGLRTNTGGQGSSGMVLYGGLQLLPCPTRFEGAIERPKGRRRYEQRTPAMAANLTGLILDGSRCALYAGVSSGRYGIISCNHLVSRKAARACAILRDRSQSLTVRGQDQSVIFAQAQRPLQGRKILVGDYFSMSCNQQLEFGEVSKAIEVGAHMSLIEDDMGITLEEVASSVYSQVWDAGNSLFPLLQTPQQQRRGACGLVLYGTDDLTGEGEDVFSVVYEPGIEQFFFRSVEQVSPVELLANADAQRHLSRGAVGRSLLNHSDDREKPTILGSCWHSAEHASIRDAEGQGEKRLG